MKAEIYNSLLEKNNKLINMVIERAQRDYPSDIALIGLTGSFSTGDFHEKSDVDLIIINNTDRGWGISSCFILDDVGYDIYCTPWETRIDAQSKLESPFVSCLINLKVLYSASETDLQRFNEYKQRALTLLSQEIGKESLKRTEKFLEKSKLYYAESLLSPTEGKSRFYCGLCLREIVNALVSLNNTYIAQGIKRYREIISSLHFLPAHALSLFDSVCNAKNARESQGALYELLSAVNELYHEVFQNKVPAPVPTSESLQGTYEELWCNYRNKIIRSCDDNDVPYAFFAGTDAQQFFQEMVKEVGAKPIDLMQFFDPENLPHFKLKFLECMELFLQEYKKVNLSIKQYHTFEELYADYMK